jgi:hypothetical protein
MITISLDVYYAGSLVRYHVAARDVSRVENRAFCRPCRNGYTWKSFFLNGKVSMTLWKLR